jgi:hypothetical protein
MCTHDKNNKVGTRIRQRTCSITRVCRSSQCLSFAKTSVSRKNGPKTSTMPGHRMSSLVVKDLIKLLETSELVYDDASVEDVLLHFHLLESWVSK